MCGATRGSVQELTEGSVENRNSQHGRWCFYAQLNSVQRKRIPREHARFNCIRDLGIHLSDTRPRTSSTVDRRAHPDKARS